MCKASNKSTHISLVKYLVTIINLKGFCCSVQGFLITAISHCVQNKKKTLLTNFRYNLFLTDGFFHGQFDKPDGWFHLVLNYIGPAEGQGVTIYKDGVLQGSGTDKIVGTTYMEGDGRMFIGRWYTEREGRYASVEADELTFWNRALTLEEIKAIYDMDA